MIGSVSLICTPAGVYISYRLPSRYNTYTCLNLTNHDTTTSRLYTSTLEHTLFRQHIYPFRSWYTV